MSDYNLNTISLDDLLFILGGFVFQGETSEDMDMALLLRLEELLILKIQERGSEIPEGTILH